MFETEITQNRFLLGYAGLLAADIPAERFTEQPLPDVNHPAWIFGHLCLTGEAGVGFLGGEKTIGMTWTKRFAPGSAVTSALSDYPAKAELVAKFESTYARLQAQAAAASAEQLAAPNPHPRLKERLPTVRDAVAFLLTGHLAMHLGQLSMWRRMIGLPPLF